NPRLEITGSSTITTFETKTHRFHLLLRKHRLDRFRIEIGECRSSLVLKSFLCATAPLLFPGDSASSAFPLSFRVIYRQICGRANILMRAITAFIAWSCYHLHRSQFHLFFEFRSHRRNLLLWLTV